MLPSTVQQLLEVNRRFYADFGAEFSATRQRIQPGVRKIIADFGSHENILDLGCGNGGFARALAETGFRGSYTGLDFSLPLLEHAKLATDQFSICVLSADLSAPDWENLLGSNKFSTITAYAVLHHIPSLNLRLEILRKVRNLLEPGGRFIHSNWQFLNSPKLTRRIQSWDRLGLSDSDVDPDDYLLDWRTGGSALRYAHHFSISELAKLAAETGFFVKGTFLSDGDNQRLGLYQIWECYENQD